MQRVVILSLCIVMMLLGCAAQPEKPQLYTAYNIWLHRGDLYCINFKLGSNFIPAGTPITKLYVTNNRDWQDISFKTADTNRRVTIQFEERWHPGQTIRSYVKKMFTTKNFSELTSGLTPEEIRGIKSGIVTVGMSKRAVLVSYGYPPEHYTKVLSGNEWYYWINRMRKKKICFDENQRAQRCGYHLPSNRL